MRATVGLTERSWLMQLIVSVSLTFTLVATCEAASSWYVAAGAGPGGNGTRSKPWSTLQEAEMMSRPGDTIFVVPARQTLDGGIQLKDGQRLIGLGDPVTKAQTDIAMPTITNTTDSRYGGDAVRLANNNLVQNIHIDGAFRAGILGINSVKAQVRNNLITRNMIDRNDLRDLETRFILYQSQGNHFAGITLLACGPAQSSYCVTHGPGIAASTNTDQVVVSGNVVRDSNLEGILILTDTGVVASYTLADNLVKDLSLSLPKPESLTPPVGIVRSRAFTLIALNGSRVTLNMNRFRAENLAPAGNYASDGAVFLTGGTGPIVTAHVSDLVVLNPRMTGEVNNGDSVEIQHRGTSDGVLNIDITRAELRDPASANIKVLEAQNPSDGVYNISVTDSVLSNANPAGGPDSQIRFSGASKGATKAFNLTVKNTRISGIGGAIGILNSNNLGTLAVAVENSSFSDLSQPTGATSVAAVLVTHPADRMFKTATVDLGGGSLGSRGKNRFVNKNLLDLSVTNSNSSAPAIQVTASDNYWGGGAPALSPTASADVMLSGNVSFSAPKHLTADPGR